MKYKTYYVRFIVTLYDDEEPTEENILQYFEGLESDDVRDIFVDMEEREKISSEIFNFFT
mgnify:CR=1 FL=1